MGGVVSRGLLVRFQQAQYFIPAIIIWGLSTVLSHVLQCRDRIIKMNL